MEIREPTTGDLPVIKDMLAAAGLPALEVLGSQAKDFRVVQNGTSVVGAVGLERYGDDGLLRSLVVMPQTRGHGLGESLVVAIEDHARAKRLRSLVLLTTTAERFFDRLGDEVISRDAMRLLCVHPQNFQRSVPPLRSACARH